MFVLRTGVIFMAEQWVTMKVAAERLGIPASKISRWANRGLIQVKPNPFDRRSRLINLNELRARLAELNAIQDLGDDDEQED
jgi:DNA-binding transcriptional MerR regulator